MVLAPLAGPAHTLCAASHVRMVGKGGPWRWGGVLRGIVVLAPAGVARLLCCALDLSCWTLLDLLHLARLWTV